MMMINVSDHQDVYAALLARSAQRENRAMAGRAVAAQADERHGRQRALVLSAVTDTPKTAPTIAAELNLRVDSVRRQLASLYVTGAITRSPRPIALRGGHGPAEWVRTKDTTK